MAGRFISISLLLAGLVLVGPWCGNAMLGAGLALSMRCPLPRGPSSRQKTLCEHSLSLFRALLLAAFLPIVASFMWFSSGLHLSCHAIPRPDGGTDRLWVLSRPLSEPPVPGELVLRSLPGSSDAVVDRVLAVRGDSIHIAQGVVVVNGREIPAALGPLASVSPLVTLERTLGPDEFAVVPSLARWTPIGEPEGTPRDRAIADQIVLATIIDASQLRGEVVLVRRGAWRWLSADLIE